MAKKKLNDKEALELGGEMYSFSKIYKNMKNIAKTKFGKMKDPPRLFIYLQLE